MACQVYLTNIIINKRSHKLVHCNLKEILSVSSKVHAGINTFSKVALLENYLSNTKQLLILDQTCVELVYAWTPLYLKYW